MKREEGVEGGGGERTGCEGGEEREEEEEEKWQEKVTKSTLHVLFQVNTSFSFAQVTLCVNGAI